MPSQTVQAQPACDESPRGKYDAVLLGTSKEDRSHSEYLSSNGSSTDKICTIAVYIAQIHIIFETRASLFEANNCYLPKWVILRDLGVMLGTFFAIIAVASLTGLPAQGAIAEGGDNMVGLIIFCGAVMLTGAGLVACAAFISGREKKRKASEAEQ